MSSTYQISALLHKPTALTREDAHLLYPVLDNALISNTKVYLSFKGLENCSTIFLRYTLGALYLKFGSKVDELLSITEIAKDNEVLPNQIKRLKERALGSPDFKKIFDQAIGEA